MARIRSLKPGFFTNEHLCELSPWHRLCFAGLWTLADREGRLEDRPRRIKAALFPYDDLDVDQLLDGLAEKDFVVRYVAEGVPYLAVKTFHQHQRPKNDEYPSAIPAPLLEHTRGKDTAPRSYKGHGDLDRGQRTEGVGADVAPLAATDGVAQVRETADGAGARRRAEAFAELWNTTTTPPIPRCRDLTNKRRRQVKSRLTERPLTEWADVFRRLEGSSFCRGKNDRDWVASFDWVVGSPDVAVKVLEGKYDDRGQAAKLYEPWSCPHVDPCGNRATCANATFLQRPERAKP